MPAQAGKLIAAMPVGVLRPGWTPGCSRMMEADADKEKTPWRKMWWLKASGESRVGSP